MSLRIPVPAGKLPQSGGRALFEFDDKSLALFNVEGDVFAIDDSCPPMSRSVDASRAAWFDASERNDSRDSEASCRA